jgi:hypothetical protein
VVSAGLPALTTSTLTTGDGEVRLYLDVTGENNLPTWWATTVLILGAIACALVSNLSGPGTQRRQWAGLSVLLAVLSVDEMTSLHERLDRIVAGRIDLGDYPFLWVVPGAVVGTVVLVGVLTLVRNAPGPARRWLIAGFALILAAALGGEVLQGLQVARGATGPLYVLTIHGEEAGETLGAIAVLTGAVRMLELHRSRGGVLIRVQGAVGSAQVDPGRL